ncbi:MAG: extracellular solute-binding protein family 1 [Paenibacillus sp.]|jgi:multiple sugar transport system substrate-binding protein|nr:extracellular solute-binding protein family 1 [Paenibacillus sp.]
MNAKKLVFSAAALCLVLSACSGNDSGSSTADKPDSAKPAQQPAAADAQNIANTPATLTVTQPGLSEELFNTRYGDQIRKKFPNYTIKYVNTTAANYADFIATNPQLDILFASGTGLPVYLTNYKLESSINDLIAKNKFDINRLNPIPVNMMKKLSNGEVYGFPVNLGMLIFQYNKDLFDKFGVPYPSDGMTWDDTYEVARKMTRTEGGVGYKGLMFAWEHVVGWNQLSALYFDPATNKSLVATSDGVKRVYENAARFWKIPGNEPPGNKYDLGKMRDWFTKDQNTAMYLDADGLISITLASPLKNWDLAKFPQFPDKKGVGPSPNPTLSFITKLSKNRDAAFQVLAYLTSDEFQEWGARTQGYTPVLSNSKAIMDNFGKDIPGFAGKNTKALLFDSFAEMQQNSPYYSIGVAETNKAINEYLTGKDLNTALREASERIDKAVAERLAQTAGK